MAPVLLIFLELGRAVSAVLPENRRVRRDRFNVVLTMQGPSVFICVHPWLMFFFTIS
jgi:hypothetical protein